MTAPPQAVLPGPSAGLADGLVRLEGLLAAAHPLKAKHRAALPRGIARLSELLTTGRGDLPRDYMARPEHLAAYLHWFLPWNLLRQGRLLQGLGLDLPDGTRVVDLGAGPLTFALALWLARPDLRARELHVAAVDRAEPALRAGRALFAALTGEADTPWRVTTHRGAAGGRGTGPADLLVAANLLNEIEAERRGRRRGPDLDADEALVAGWERMAAPDGRVLLIEPGARAPAARLARVRAAALARGWGVAAPCTHAAACPLPGGRAGWCHFTADAAGAPRWLEDLGRRARLPKERVALSFLLLEAPGREGTATPAGPGVPVRVVSEAFDLPEGRRGCYACGPDGLVLLTRAAGARRGLPASGEAVSAPVPARPRRDPRSGAPVVPLD